MSDSEPINEQAGAPDIADLKSELQTAAEARGLSTDGTKAEILERIEEHDKGSDEGSEPAGSEMLSEGAPVFEEPLDETDQALEGDALDETPGRSERFNTQGGVSDGNQGDALLGFGPQGDTETSEADELFGEGNLSVEQAEAKAAYIPEDAPYNPNGPIDEMPTHIQQEIAARDQALQAKVDAKSRKQQDKDKVENA